ncbi:MAG: IS1595 family transposase [Xanthobacteraceae bacterium]
MAKRKEFGSLYDLFAAIPDEQAAIDWFREIRWANGEYCPYCGHDEIYTFTDRRTFKCADCRQRFSIRVGTIFEYSKIPLRKWLAAIWVITSHKKGIASTQLARDLGITQKSAWFMLHRLRHAARTRSFNRQLRGTVEVDETFFGGKDKNKPVHRRGRKEKKTAVFGVLERQGELRAKPIKSVSVMTDEIRKNVAPGMRLMTDEWPAFQYFSGRYEHGSVKHSDNEYVRKGTDVHINTIEGFWSQLKRQVYGIHHWVSAKHLHRYVDESVWRYNRRELGEVGRMREFLTRVDGRLTYPALIAKA